MRIYYAVSRDSVSRPGHRAYLRSHGHSFATPDMAGPDTDNFATLQDAVEAVANLPPFESLDGLRIERIGERRPAIEVLEDLRDQVELALEGAGLNSRTIQNLVDEATDLINQESAS